MKVSHEWLQTYFDEPLESVDVLADLITFHSFEMEGIEKHDDDSVLDIDVLSNRSSDCLCHRGIAKELSVLLNRADEFREHDPLAKELTALPKPDHCVVVDATEKVQRFSTFAMQGVKVGESPQWLKKRLAVLNQKSINNVVDATNYVMLNIGQPLHAFDRDKLKGKGTTQGLTVRLAKKEEKITTLSGEVCELDEHDVLIVDSVSNEPLGIAGIKGGKQAEIDAETTDIILEAANFDYVSVRKTSKRLKLATDASVRFQNQPSPELTLFALRDVVKLIQEIAGGEITGATDWYPNRPEKKSMQVSIDDINSLAGTQLDEENVASILSRFLWEFSVKDGTFNVSAPWERTDLNRKEDYVEEVARISGYRNLTALQLTRDHNTHTNNQYVLATAIREALVALGFSEVYTYTMRSHGAVVLANSLASDKAFLRSTLADGVSEALTLNMRNAPLLGLEQIKLFEIGTVFTNDGERVHLCLGVQFARKFKGVLPEDVLQEALSTLSEKLGTSLSKAGKDGVVELALTDITTNISLEGQGGGQKNKTLTYRSFSQYPFALRDIALWAPAGTQKETMLELIQSEGGELLVRCDLFDEFHKEDKVSFAFHLVFQASDKTLTDTEINEIMTRITARLNQQVGVEVR